MSTGWRRGIGKRYRVRGERLTAREIAEHYGLSESSFKERMQRGWSAEKAATEPRRRREARRYRVRGELLTAREIAIKYGLDRKVFETRLKKGFTVERAATAPVRSVIKRRYFRIDGERLTAQQIARRFRITEGAFLTRIHVMGWAPTRAAKEPLRKTPRYRVRGERLTLKELSAKYGVPWGTIWARIQKNGWSPERAATESTDREKRYHVGGRMLTTAQIAQRYGTKRGLFCRRLLMGWSAARAATEPARKSYLVHGERLTSDQITQKYGIPLSRFFSRLRKGWSADDAVLRPRRPGEWRKRYSVHGVELTIVAMARKYAVGAGTIRSRLRSGLSPEEAVTPLTKVRCAPARPPPRGTVYLVGGERLTVKQITDRFGVRSDTFYRRLHKGWDADRAATTGVRHAATFEIHGVRLTPRQIQAKYGTNATTFCSRIERGVLPEKAIEVSARMPDRTYPVGDEFLTSKQIIKRFGLRVQQDTFQKRLRSGWEPERAATELPGTSEPQRVKVADKPCGTIARTYTVHGEDLTASQVEAQYGIDAQKFRWRVRMGWSPEEAVTSKRLPRRTVHAARHQVHGESLTAAEVAEKYDIDEKKFRWRVRMGWTTEEAIKPTGKVSERHRLSEAKRYVVHGKEMTARQVETKYGIAAQKFRGRILRGWTTEQAVKSSREVAMDSRMTYVVCGHAMSMDQIRRVFGITGNTFHARLRNGWNTDRAAITPVRSSDTVIVAGKELTFTEIQKTYSVNRATVRSRIERGFSPEMAVDRRLISEAVRYRVNGESLAAAEVAKKYRVDARKFRWRVKRGVRPEDAIRPERLPRRGSYAPGE